MNLDMVGFYVMGSHMRICTNQIIVVPIDIIPLFKCK